MITNLRRYFISLLIKSDYKTDKQKKKSAQQTNTWIMAKTDQDRMLGSRHVDKYIRTMKLERESG